MPAVTSPTASTPAAVANRGDSFKGAFFPGRRTVPGVRTFRVCAGTNRDTRGVESRCSGRRARADRPTACFIDSWRFQDDHTAGIAGTRLHTLCPPLPPPCTSTVKHHRNRLTEYTRPSLNNCRSLTFNSSMTFTGLARICPARRVGGDDAASQYRALGQPAARYRFPCCPGSS